MNSALSVAFRLISCLLIASCSTSAPSSWKPRNLQQSICSCSPRSFTLTLDFLQGCLDNTVESNTGISSPTECTIEVGDPDTSTRKLEDIVVLGIAINTFDEKSWNDIVKKKELGSSNKLRDNIRRKLQDEQATTPTIITSITFIELNALGTVINVDDQYMNGNFDNGALINLQSISSTISANIPLENQLELVPSTQVLFMEGLNAAGEEVRGRFVWNYTNSCASNAVAIRQGDELAWIQFTEVEEQIFSICPANENVVPTIVPIDIMTPNPTVSFMRYSMQFLFRLYHDELIVLPFNSQPRRPSRKDQRLRYLRHRRSSGLLNRQSYHHW